MKVLIIREYFEYLKASKKWWLLPIIIFLILLGFILVVSESSVLAPFLYTLF